MLARRRASPEHVPENDSDRKRDKEEIRPPSVRPGQKPAQEEEYRSPRHDPRQESQECLNVHVPDECQHTRSVAGHLDGGVRRGTDVLKALALGAKACMTGRPFLYGLAAGGGAGVDKAFDIFAAEIRRAMMLAGRPTIDDIGPNLVRPAG
ncbi:MAG: alpha-hydroxy-acid oxidizing protein [Proteobacteria bacterium]|nr:alpha-hydroxy-acid oxidizing protein [Pseudomonadota bacterium]